MIENIDGSNVTNTSKLNRVITSRLRGSGHGYVLPLNFEVIRLSNLSNRDATTLEVNRPSFANLTNLFGVVTRLLDVLVIHKLGSLLQTYIPGSTDDRTNLFTVITSILR